MYHFNKLGDSNVRNVELFVEFLDKEIIKFKTLSNHWDKILTCLFIFWQTNDIFDWVEQIFVDCFLLCKIIVEFGSYMRKPHVYRTWHL